MAVSATQAHLREWADASENEFKQALLRGSSCFPRYALIYGQINATFQQLAERAQTPIALDAYRRDVRAALARMRAVPHFAAAIQCCFQGSGALPLCARRICDRNMALLRELRPRPREAPAARDLRRRLTCLVNFVLQMYS